MLERIIAIANVGRFRNSAGAPTPGLARHTFIFGPNGYGKTTFCAALRSLERDEAHHIVGRRTLGTEDPPFVNLLWNGAQRTFRDGRWPGPEPRLSIFDGTFVAENVHSGDLVDVANRRNLYRIVVGRNGVGLAREEQRLAEEARAIQQRLGAAERALDPLLGGVTTRAFDGLAADPEIEAKLEEARAALASQQNAAAIQARAGLQRVIPPALPHDLAAILQNTIEGGDPSVEARVAQHLAAHDLGAEGEAWLAQGVAMADHDDCPFCGRDGTAAVPLVQAYRTFFSDAYNALRGEIDRLREQSDQQFGAGAFGELRAVAIGNTGTREFWMQHCDLGEDLPALNGLRATYEHAVQRVQDILADKSARPLEVVDRTAALAELAEVVGEITRTIAAYNAAVDGANAAIESHRARTAAGNEQAIRQAITDLERVARRHGPVGSGLCDVWRREVEAKRDNTAAKAEVRRLLEEHCRQVVQPYQVRINHFLRLFNAGFEIVDVDHAYPGGMATCTYRLRINNVDVPLGDGRTDDAEHSFKNTLSAGDRTTLALAFFLAELEREPDIAQRVVIFDDPFNSQDSFRRRNTIHEIMAVARTGAQVIVLSHDAQFLKSLWQKSPAAERASAQLVYHQATGTKIVAFDLDNACQGRAQQELDDLIAFRNANVGEPRDVIKKLRIVLETHFREMYPAAFAADDNFGAILRKIREGGPEHPAAAWYQELERINDYTQDYHHGEDPRGAAEPPLDRDELHGFVGQTLTLANAVVG